MKYSLCLFLVLTCFPFAACTSQQKLSVATPVFASPTIRPTFPSYPYFGPVPSVVSKSIQTGMIFPQYGKDGYGADDHNFPTGLQEIKQQTHAQWLSIPIFFYQPNGLIPAFADDPNITQSPESVRDGIRRAHEQGFRVFIFPLVSGYIDGDSLWVGSLPYNAAGWQVYFTALWSAYQPYILIAQQEHVEQVAIGHEFGRAETIATLSTWTTYLNNIRSVYSGALTYDMNWDDLVYLPGFTPPICANPNITMIGISEYMPLSSSVHAVDPTTVVSLWSQKVVPTLRTLEQHITKPFFFAEVGFRNTSDALYHPSDWSTSAPPDPDLQAAAYNAVLTTVVNDSHIAGVYFWGWSTGQFAPNGLAASVVLKAWYTLLEGGEHVSIR